MSFIKDVADERERNSPVRAAVKARATDIQSARAAGQPLNAIYRTLRRGGHSVGKGYSSFRAAVRYLDQHGWPDDGTSVAPAAVASGSPPIVTDAGAAQVSRDSFADDRNPSDF